MPHRRAVEIHTAQITLGALLKWARVASTGGEAKALVAGRRVIVNGQVETRRGRRLVPGDLVAVQGGPTVVVTRANDVPSAKTLAPGIP
ncbi:MAG: RNA-binding S4 domain-containing protein [Armatimonadota bacterium]|nr:RNA-binding S4 domain-containing protein [Armatimonadota bacterium]